jgi:inositol hexakisphosphate/diphosphoinositol-pentakisphosphate kinase
MQQVLFDRRLVLDILDKVGIETPKRLVTWNKDCPKLSKDVSKKLEKLGIDLKRYDSEYVAASHVDEDSIVIDGNVLKKPFVEKPVSGEDHNIYVYFSKEQGFGGRKLFRKVGNKSSEFDPQLVTIRCSNNESYIYEEFIDVDNAEDVKVYTLGSNFAYAETRKSPVVDGVVRRTADGKEIRYVTELTAEEKIIAKKVCQTFGQTVCGFDLLRAQGKSFVIDVNGWSFVKGNQDYYDKCAAMIRDTFLTQIKSRGLIMRPSEKNLENQWNLKFFISVMRHGDRTPKQKMKFSFKSPMFLNLIPQPSTNSSEDIVLKNPDQFKEICNVAIQAMKEGLEDPVALEQLSHILFEKGFVAGTKVQLKPSYNKQSGSLEKMQIIVKWGGLLTHGGIEHSKGLGSSLRSDLAIINKSLVGIEDLKVYSSSEIRVIATAEAFCKAFLDSPDLPPHLIQIQKEMLDDSNNAKEQVHVVKEKLRSILNPEHPAKPPKEFLMPQGLTDLSVPIQQLIHLLQQLRLMMRENLKSSKKAEFTWCTPETPLLFQERWEKLFRDFCDVERPKFEPSKISELYDSIKYDLLHNRAFIEFAFWHPKRKDLVHELFYKCQEVFEIIGPHEYGIEKIEKLIIGFQNTSLLLNQICQDLTEATKSSASSSRLYFTKESKVYCLLNVLLLCGLKTKVVPTDIVELDCSFL